MGGSGVLYWVDRRWGMEWRTEDCGLRIGAKEKKVYEMLEEGKRRRTVVMRWEVVGGWSGV